MLKSSTRQFEPEITRSGGQPSRVRYTIRCSKCPSTSANTATYEARRAVEDEVVASWFQRKGWVLGRNSRSFDVCPSCLGITITDENRLASHLKVSSKGNPVLSPAQLAEQVFMAQKPKDDTASILERHFGKPKSEQVQQPAPQATPGAPKRERLGLPSIDRRPSSTASVSKAALAAPVPAPVPAAGAADGNDALLNVMSGIATDMQNTRAAMELMVEQLSKMVMLQNEQTNLHKEELTAQRQQIEAVARLAPLVARSAEGVAGSVREAISQIREAAAPAAIAHPDDEVITLPSQAEAAPAPQPRAARAEEVGAVKRPRGRPRKAEAATPVPPVSVGKAEKKERKQPERVTEEGRNQRFLTLALAFPHPTTFGAKEALETIPQLGYLQNAYGNLKTAAKRGLTESLGGGQFRFTASAAKHLRAALGDAAVGARAPAERAPSKTAKAETASTAAPAADGAAVEGKRPRGRPRKHPRPEDVARQAGATATATPAAAKASTKSKTKQAAKAASAAVAPEVAAPAIAQATASEPVVVKRPRGRPRKHPRPEDLARQAVAALPALPAPAKAAAKEKTKQAAKAPVAVHAEAADPVVVKRPRGRPRKHPHPEDVAAQTGVVVPAKAAAPAAVKAPKKAPSKQDAPKLAAAQPELHLGIEPDLGIEPVVKRPRGRPRKHPRPEDLAAPAATAPKVAKPARAATPAPEAAEDSAGLSPVAAKTSELLSRVNWGEKEWSRHVSVYSQPDRKSPKKFSTVIQLERKFWDKAGFGPEDRLQIERNQDEVVITRAESGGVKPKKVGDTTVVIQANTLGNLNLKQVKAAADEEAMVLRGSRV